MNFVQISKYVFVVAVTLLVDRRIIQTPFWTSNSPPPRALQAPNPPPCRSVPSPPRSPYTAHTSGDGRSVPTEYQEYYDKIAPRACTQCPNVTAVDLESQAVLRAKAGPQGARWFVENRYKDIQGWFFNRAFSAIAILSKLQHSLGIRGSVGEIGVHHGKSFIGIALNSLTVEPMWVCDIFEQQQLNVDKSGAGSYEAFRTNVKNSGIDVESINFFRGSSTDIPADHFCKVGLPPFRFLSVDGGHTENTTLLDLHLGSCNVMEGGIITVDDIHNIHWLGVRGGVYSFLQFAHKRWVPFFMAEKLFLTTVSHHAQYLAAILEHPIMQAADVVALPHRTEMLGWQVAVAPAEDQGNIDQWLLNEMWV